MSNELKPDDEITVTVNDFETKYVSRASYDALRERAERYEQVLIAIRSEPRLSAWTANQFREMAAAALLAAHDAGKEQP